MSDAAMDRSRRRLMFSAARAASATLLMTLAVSTARAQSGAPQPSPTLQSERRTTLFPSTDLYGVYVADPERPTNTISFRFYGHDAIPETRTPRA
jgi:hypothetical protein